MLDYTVDRSQTTNTVPESWVANQEATAQTQVPGACSMCKYLLHTACIRPTK